MELSAITNRGSKKDFIDIALLMEKLGLEQMIALYRYKYPVGMEMMILRSLVYFKDAEDQADPVMLVPYDWGTIKEYILNETNKYINEPNA